LQRLNSTPGKRRADLADFVTKRLHAKSGQCYAGSSACIR
jgi:hypothetical protein